MKKKIVAFLLVAVVAVASTVPFGYLDAGNNAVYAAAKSTAKEVAVKSTDGRVTEDGYTFSLDGSEATITGYQGTSKDLTIPTKISVAANATSGTSTSETTTGTTKTSTSTSSSSSSTVDYNVTAIANGAFSSKLGIQKVTMTGGTDSNGQMFGIRRIGDRAFFGCQDLTNVTIAGTTTSIGEHVFADCVALNSINVAEGNSNYKVIDGALYAYSTSSGTGSYTLIQYPLGNTSSAYTVPAAIATTLTNVATGAFWGAPNLTEITLPSTVKTIGPNAFAECKKLVTMTLPDGVVSLGQEAFRGCNSLTTVNVPEGVKTIAIGTFQNCTALKSVSLPETITSIGAQAFYGCSSMEAFVVPAATTTIGDQAFANCPGLYKMTIPVTTTAFGASVFAGTSNVIIYCHNGSQAATYAKSNKLSIELTYTVRFYSDSTYGRLISSQEVVANGDAVPPSFDGRDGYQLTWSASYQNVNADLRLYAIWDKTYKVTFIDDYNNRSEERNVVDGEYVSAPVWTMSGYSLSWDNAVSGAIHSNITAHAVWTSDTTGYVINQGTVRPKSKGSVLTAGANKYTVTSSNIEKPTVAFSGVAVSAPSVVIPSTVTVEGVQYEVKSVAAGAINGNTTVTSVKIGAKVKTIGKNAFNGCTKLGKVRVLSKGVKTIGKNAFNKVKSGTKFYCVTSKKSAIKKLLKKSGLKNPKVYSL